MTTRLVEARESVNPTQIAYVNFMREEEQARQQAVVDYRAYYDGDHDTKLTARQRRYLEVKPGQEFNKNLCPIVVDSIAERLIVTGFDAGNQGETMWQWWKHNRMDATQSDVHTAAPRDGDTYILVTWDKALGMPRFTYEPALCNGVGIRVHYDQETRQPVRASKRWQVDDGTEAGKYTRINVYYPDRVEKFICDSAEADEAAGQKPYRAEGEESHIHYYDPIKKTAIGIPVMHFKHESQGYDYGKSALHDVIPLQNALNKSIIDLLAAGDTTSFRVYYMIGQDPGDLTVQPGEIIYAGAAVEGEKVDFGAINGEDLRPLIALKDSFAVDIAQVSKTPLSKFQIASGGTHLAEGTLQQLDEGLTARVGRCQVSYGNTWEDVMSYGRKLHNLYGASGDRMDEKQLIEALWKDTKPRNEMDTLEALEVKRRLGVPLTRLWAEAGYSEQQIADMVESPEYQIYLAGLTFNEALNG